MQHKYHHINASRNSNNINSSSSNYSSNGDTRHTRTFVFGCQGDINFAFAVRRLADRYGLMQLVDKVEEELEGRSVVHVRVLGSFLV